MLRSVATRRMFHGGNNVIRHFSSSGSGTPYSKLTIGIPKERFEREKRVAATPESIQRLVTPGMTVLVEDGAGIASYFNNADYEKVGAKIVPMEQVWKDSDIVMKVSLGYRCRYC